MQSSGSPTTSDTVRLRILAGAMARASRPPLISDTCLRTVLISTTDMPEDSKSRCSVAAVAQLDRFVAAPRPARRDVGPAQERVVHHDVDLDRGQATAVEDLAGSYRADLQFAEHLMLSRQLRLTHRERVGTCGRPA